MGGNYHDCYHDLRGYNRDWTKKTLMEVATLKLIAAYNQMRLKKKNPGTLKNDQLLELAQVSYPQQYQTNPQLAKKRVVRMLKTKEVKEVADKNLIQMLTEQGITPGYLTKRRKDIMDRAKDAKKLDIELKALEGFENMLKLTAKATFQQTESTDFDYSKFLANKTTVKTIEIEGSGIGEIGGIDEKSAENEEKQAISPKQIKNDAHRCAVSEDNVPGNDKVCPLSSC